MGSVRSGGPGGLGHQAEYPYGVEYSVTANDREKYATYTRDSVTGLDYAMNRYYASQWGRFTSPDPYGGSASPSSPQSWNRYAYAGNDPANSSDPGGLDDWGWCPPGWICVGGWPGTGAGNGGVAGGGSGFGGNGPMPCIAVLGRISIDPFLRPCGSGGGSASGGGNANQSALDTAKKDLEGDLAKPDCAKDFKYASNDINKLTSIGFRDYGTVTEATAPDGSLQVTSSELGLYNQVTKSINLNSAINWSDPNNTPAIVNGQSGIYPALAAEAAYINVPTLTTGQFMDLIILHELSHYNGSIGNPDNGPAVEQQLYKDCIK